MSPISGDRPRTRGGLSVSAGDQQQQGRNHDQLNETSMWNDQSEHDVESRPRHSRKNGQLLPLRALHGAVASSRVPTQGGNVSVNQILARDRELREHATTRPWHQDGTSIRLRLVGPLPQAKVVVDPYGPNPRDAQLLLHRVNTYEDLEHEIEVLRDALRDTRARLDSTDGLAQGLPTAEILETLTADLLAQINVVLGDRRRSVRSRQVSQQPSRRSEG